MAIKLRTVKGSALTYTEADTNFSSLIYSVSQSENSIAFNTTGSDSIGKPPDSTLINVGLGQYTVATGYYSHAEGTSTIASGSYSHAEGDTTLSKGYAAHAEGNYVQALGNQSHAEGSFTVTVGDSSHAEGYYTSASGDYSHAEGYYTVSSGSTSHAEGYQTISEGAGSHAEGYSTIAHGDYSHAEGWDTEAAGIHSHAEGYQSKATGPRAHAEGSFNLSSATGSHAEGTYNTASGNWSHAEGYGTDSVGIYSHTEGYFTSASGTSAHAEGSYTLASGLESHAEGSKTRTSGRGSHSEGEYTFALGDYSHAEGRFSTSSGKTAHAEGYGTDASGSMSHSEGLYTYALGDYAHAEGAQTQALGRASHAEGYYNTATGWYSHAEGESTNAMGISSHAEGISTTARGTNSHAEGYNTIAYGQGSHAEGNGTIASGSYQHVQGQYNMTSSAAGAFIIGNGTSNLNRSNLLFASGTQVNIPGDLVTTTLLVGQGYVESLPAPFYSETFSTGTGSFVDGGGDAPWVRVTDDGNGDLFSIRSGMIGNLSNSIIQLTQTTTQQTTQLFYDYKTSTENTYDFLFIEVNGTIVKRYSGTNPWTTDSVFIHGIGTKVIRFIYRKDNNTIEGTDQVWIDNVKLINHDEGLIVNTPSLFGNTVTVSGSLVGQGLSSFDDVYVNGNLALINNQGNQSVRVVAYSVGEGGNIAIDYGGGKSGLEAYCNTTSSRITMLDPSNGSIAVTVHSGTTISPSNSPFFQMPLANTLFRIGS